MQINSCFWLLLLLSHAGGQPSIAASPGDFQDPRYEALAEQVKHSLEAPDSIVQGSAIQEINRAFASLPRADAAPDDLREMKFRLQHWRLRASLLLEEAIQNESMPARLATLLKSLESLQITLPSNEVRTLLTQSAIQAQLENPVSQVRAALLSLLATQGQGAELESIAGDSEPALVLRAGPQSDVKIPPLMPSKWPFERWSQNPEFARYEFPEAGNPNVIRYRGLTLHVGDFIIMSENDPSDGDFTSLTEDRAYASHFAMIAVLENGGVRFPSVIEIHQNGLRAVPLSRFLSAEFGSYLEVYRLKQIPAGWAEKVNAAAADELGQPHGYDFFAREEERRYLSCVTVGSLLLDRTGVTPIAGRSRVRVGFRDDFERLGAQMDRLLTPTDVVRSPRVEFIGVIDHGQYPKLVAQDLAVSEMIRIFDEGTLTMRRLPLTYYVLRWGVSNIEHDNWIGRIFLKLNGVTRENFPNASAKLLAWVLPFESRYKKMVRRASPALISEFEDREPSIQTLERDPAIRAILNLESAPIRKWFATSVPNP